VIKYIKILYELLDTAEIVDTLLQLEENLSFPPSATYIETYEQIDYILTKCMLEADERCKNMYMIRVLLSPGLVIHLSIINFWRLIIRGKGEM